MNPADHVNTVRDAFATINETEYPAYQDVILPALAALDALQAQAEDGAEMLGVALENGATLLQQERERAEAAEAERDRWKIAADAWEQAAEEMEAERDRWLQAVGEVDQYAKVLEAKVARLEAERDRLRDAAQAACDTGRPAEIRKLAQVLAALAGDDT